MLARILAYLNRSLGRLKIASPKFGEKLSESGAISGPNKATPQFPEPAPVSEEKHFNFMKYMYEKSWKMRKEELDKLKARELLWYEPYVVTASLAAFILWFRVLREESDIDLKLGKHLKKSNNETVTPINCAIDED